MWIQQFYFNFMPKKKKSIYHHKNMYTTWKKQITEDHTLYDSIYKKYQGGKYIKTELEKGLLSIAVVEWKFATNMRLWEQKCSKIKSW